MPRHAFCSLTLDSAVPLPELPGVPGDGPRWRVIPVHPLPPEGEVLWSHRWSRPEGEVSLECRRTASGYRLLFPGEGAFHVATGERTVLMPAGPTGPTETARHLLLDQVLPRVASYEGDLVLHAGAVVSSEGAWVFLGDSGHGKSTLCGALGRAGLPVLGDDGVLVERSVGGRFTAAATYPGLRLLPSARERLFGPEPGVPRGAKERIDPERARLVQAAAPLARIHVLPPPGVRRATGGPRRVRLAPREAFVALVRGSFHLDLRGRRREEARLDRLAALARTVPTFDLEVPWDLEELEATVEALLADGGDGPATGRAAAS